LGGDDGDFEFGAGAAEDAGGAGGVEVGSDEEEAADAFGFEDGEEDAGFVEGGFGLIGEADEVFGGEAAFGGETDGELVFGEAVVAGGATGVDEGGIALANEASAFENAVADGVASEDEDGVSFLGGLVEDKGVAESLEQPRREEEEGEEESGEKGDESDERGSVKASHAMGERLLLVPRVEAADGFEAVIEAFDLFFFTGGKERVGGFGGLFLLRVR